ncbi:MAG: hypothetical protein KFH98_06075, partial [Gemmatimonadetes bacterium]|nr:hypothetical protein [Gemmatimonadota bacterium]
RADLGNRSTLCVAMGALQRTLLLLTVLGAAGTVACADPFSEPSVDGPSVSGNWKGVARLDTIRLQLVDLETDIYQHFSVGGTGTYAQTATGSSWPLDVLGTIDEIMLTNASHAPLFFDVSAVEENRLTGMLLVMLRNPNGERIVQDSMPFSILRQQ